MSLARASTAQLDAHILRLVQSAPRPLRLQELAKFKSTPGRSPPLPLLLENAGNVLQTLTQRLARQIENLRELPLVVMLNPHVALCYSRYKHSFLAATSMEPPKTAEENNQFVEVLRKLLDLHADTVPEFSRGLLECRRILGANVDSVLRDQLGARIGTRLLAQHHIQLTHPPGPNFVGCVQTDVSPASMAESVADNVGALTGLAFGFAPSVKIDAGRETQLAYVPEHLEYMLTELLKNAFRAQCARGEHVTESSPITVTVINSGRGAIVRIRDRGGGIHPEMEDSVFRFAVSSVERQHEGLVDFEDTSLAGLGFGLPLSKIYAEFFGGSLQLQSYHGWGTDAYLTLNSPLTPGFHKDVY